MTTALQLTPYDELLRLLWAKLQTALAIATELDAAHRLGEVEGLCHQAASVARLAKNSS